LNVEFYQPLETVSEIVLTNLLGQQRYAQKIALQQSHFVIDLETFEKGVYICQIKQGDTLIFSERVLIIK